MGNFLLACLSHGANESMISKTTKQKRCCFDGSRKLLIHVGWSKKAKLRRDDHKTAANASEYYSSKPSCSEAADHHHLEKGEKGVIRVKVILTKKEAARLLSTSVGDEEKTLLTHELLNQLENHHIISAVTLGSSHGAGWRPVLESIPEDRILLR